MNFIYQTALFSLFSFFIACHPSASNFQVTEPSLDLDASAAQKSDAAAYRLDSGMSQERSDANPAASNDSNTAWCEELSDCCERFPRSMIDKCRMAVATQDEQACHELLQTAVGEVLCAPDQTGRNEQSPIDAGSNFKPDSSLEMGRDAAGGQEDAARSDSGGRRPRPDAGRFAPDAFLRIDGGRLPGPDVGQGLMDVGVFDSGRPPRMDAALMNPVCQEFFNCCPQLPAGPPRNMCYRVSGRDVPVNCIRELNRARAMGFCLTQDAGP